MMSEEQFELKIENAPPLIPKIVEEYIKRLEEQNKQLQKQVDDLEEALAETYTILITNGFEIVIDSKNLSELINDE